MADLPVYSDLELFLTAWFRAWLPTRPEAVCQDVEVVLTEPTEPPFPAKLLVVRDDGGVDTDYATAEAAIAIGVLAGTQLNPKEANDLARIVYAGIALLPAAGFATDLVDANEDPISNPVAAVLERRRPIAVTEDQDRARRYITATLVLSPEAL